MKIVKCTKCKKYVHKTGKCFHCGNTVGFDEVEMPAIHENAAAEYSEVESLVESKKFAEALTLSHTVIEWMPNLAGIFWLRLLAKNKCSNAAELIQKGFNCEEDADFCNALTFSTGAERSAYQDVRSMVLAAQKALKAEVLNHEYHCKMKTNILQIKKTMKGEVDSRKKKLFTLWAELEETEHSMYTLEKDCILLSKEHSDTLDKAAQAASSIKTETYRLEECTAENLHKYQVRIGNILQQSEQAKDALESMKKQHPWVKSFNDLVKKRDEQVRQITNEISSLKVYEATVQQTLDEIDQIEQRHRTAIRAVETFDFLDAANLLGKDAYNTVLRGISLGVDVQISVSSQGWQPNTTYTTPIDVDDDDSDDYYSALGLPNDNY